MTLHKNLFITAFCVFPLAVLLPACTGSKRAAVSKEITTAKALSSSESAMLEKLKQANSEKFIQEKTDSTIYSNINLKLVEYSNQLDSFDIYIRLIDSLIRSNKIFRKNKKDISQQLVYVKNYSNNSPQRLRRFTMIDDGLSIAQQYLFNLAAFFGPGKYQIHEEKKGEAAITFSPILDSISSFYKKYNDVSKFATIRILGFADGMGFNMDSETAKNLLLLLNDSLATKEQLNGKLSELRARNIANLLDNILSTKIDNYKDIQHLEFLFFETGKGEAYPSKKITDYQVNDERRRVVLLFWSILPK